MSPSPQINYIPDPANPDILYGQNDPHYSAIQIYYNDKAQYRSIDASAADLAQRTWKQWAVGAVQANNMGQFATYRAAPVAPAGHTVTWNGSAATVAQNGPPVWKPDPNWNVNDWQTSQTGTGEDLVHVTVGPRAGSGGAIVASVPQSVDLATLLAQLQAILAARQGH